MTIIVPANTLATGGYDVDNSVRFESGSDDYIRRENTGSDFSASGSKLFTYSIWLKRSKLGSFMQIYAIGSGGARDYAAFDGDDKIEFAQYNGGVKYQLTTSRVFRDTSAWYHLVFAVDTTNGTANNRVRLYVNGVEETSFSTRTNPDQNQAILPNTQCDSYVLGADTDFSNESSTYYAETCFVSGSQETATPFGEFDEDSGIWKPKKITATLASDSYLYEFKNSSAFGADTSGLGNSAGTINGLTAIDQSTDTCTNNFATLNSLDTHPSATLSEGNLKIATTASGWHGSSTTIGITLGQSLYFEAKAVSNARLYFGLSRTGEGVAGTARNNVAEGDGNWDYMWRTTTANQVYYRGNSQSITIGAISANDICACRVNTDGQVIFYKNDSVVVTFSTTLVAGYFYFPILSANAFGGGTESWLANFGNPAYAISSTNTDPDGYGNFEFATKSAYALNTKNLAEYG